MVPAILSPSPNRGRRLATAERRTELLEAGIQLFAEHGVWDLSAAALARAAGASKALLFHYFGSKRGYFLAVVEEIADRVATVTAPDPRLPLELNLPRRVASFVDFVEDNPAVYRLLRGNVGGDEEVHAIAERVRRVEVERVIEQLGIERPGALLRTAIHGWIGFVESATLRWVDHRGFSREHLVELCVGAAGAIVAHAQGQD